MKKDNLLIGTGIGAAALFVLALVLVRIGIIAFVLWLAYKLVMHFTGGN